MRVAIVVVLVLWGCGNKKEAAKSADPGKDAAAAAVARDAGAAGDAGAARPAAVLPRDQVDALVARWLEAQNAGDFAAYSALYADPFAGVRRSGKQTVRLDRAGWLADRKKMFAKPMLVGARDLEVVLSPKRAIVRFTQEWSSGKYQDVGPKVIEVVAQGADLRIAREEMLASRIVKPPRAGDQALPPLLPLHRGMVVLTDEVEARWGKGEPRLERGSLPERDPECDEDPPDYEQESNRYWDCAYTDPERGTASFVATRAVEVGALPADLASWNGAKVRLGGIGPGCTATVARLELLAERETTFGEVTDDGTDDTSIAGAVMDSGAPVLVAILAGGCKATYAQRADAAAAAELPLAKAPAALVTAVRARMRADGVDDGRDDVEVHVVGDKLAIGVLEEHHCEAYGLHVVYALAQGQPSGPPVLDDHDPGTLLDAVDADGDGWPELVFDDGVALRDPETDSYDRIRTVRFPDEIADCGD